MGAIIYFIEGSLIYYVKRSNGDINAVFTFSRCLKWNIILKEVL